MSVGRSAADQGSVLMARSLTLAHMSDVTTYIVRAEPLTEAAFAPFGQVVREGDCVMELRGDERFHLNVLHYDRKPLRCDHLNRHNRATQMLVALAGKPTLLVVGPKEYEFSTTDHLPHARAFLCDGTAGVNLALGTWHWGPYPVADYVDLVNVQGAGFADDNDIAYLERDLNTVIEVQL
jgi:ureidoglycolate lyase